MDNSGECGRIHAAVGCNAPPHRFPAKNRVPESNAEQNHSKRLDMGTKRNKRPATDEPIAATRCVGVGALIYRTLTADVLQIELTQETIDAIKRGVSVVLTANAADVAGARFENGQAISVALSVRGEIPKKSPKEK